MRRSNLHGSVYGYHLVIVIRIVEDVVHVLLTGCARYNSRPTAPIGGHITVQNKLNKYEIFR